jgi:hypothetical protein
MKPKQTKTQKSQTIVLMGPTTLYDVDGSGSTIKLYWRDEPAKGELKIQLPPEKPIRDEERKELVNQIARFLQSALPRETAEDEIEVASVIVKITAQKLHSFPKEDLDIFLSEIYYYLSPWTHLPIQKADIAMDYVE